MRKKIVAAALFFSVLLMMTPAYADVAVGDVIVTLGEDLTQEQRQTVLEDMEVNENEVTIITVSNEEEHQYLGQYIPKAQIGSRALSSSKITYTSPGSGLNVTTNHITYVKDNMYTNALITAGVKDADIYVTAPFDVSGTAGLTGILKAYEVSTNQQIPEEQKQVANEEMVKTAELGEAIGSDEANALMAEIKQQIAEQQPATEAEVQQIVQQTVENSGLTIDPQWIEQLTALFNRMKDLNINWDELGQQIDQAKDKWTDFINSEEGQNFWEQVKAFFVSIFNFLANLFRSIASWFQ
ncbi:DUF1002 domain-containing protein [Aureibacillus halotolerans]|uniref:DUF1002 domain-containing protein n=1 Tax=Aureibacillus halotolerans TaxID=1508390 RepID=UPI0010610220|nr:DUF1002 domain-containing protein [Aureibacillus halotolerans]